MSAPNRPGIRVIGHLNPDTDAAVSAAGYARFLQLQERYDADVQAAVAGPVTPQAQWVFDQADVAVPEIVDSFELRVCDAACLEPAAVKTNERLGKAIDILIRTGYSMLPVVGEDGKLAAVFSNREDVTRFLISLDVVPIIGTLLQWDDLCAMPFATRLTPMPDQLDLFGSLCTAMSGDESWRDEICADDILVCGDVSTWGTLEETQRPKWLIVVSTTKPSAAATEVIAAAGTSILWYQGTLSHFVQTLPMQIKLSQLALGEGLVVGHQDRLDDVREMIETSGRALAVIDEDGRLSGVISRRDLDCPNNRRVVIVDHFESTQSVTGIDHVEILEIIDHHRIGNFETNGPIRVDCRPIGSSASIVALNYFEAGIEPDRATAILLLGGMMADTLALKGPTATNRDRYVASRLSEIAGVDLEEFGVAVLKAGDDLLTAIPADIWSRDQKFFSIRNRRFAVAQLETVALRDIPLRRLNEFRQLLIDQFKEHDLIGSLLVVTDVLTRDSWITSVEADETTGAVESAFGCLQPHDNWIEAPGVVSRKKQIVPALMRAYAEVGEEAAV